MNRFVKLLLGIFAGVGLVFGLFISLQSVPVAAQTAPERSEVIQTALGYLKAQQQADGGILGFSGVSDPDTTTRTVLAFLAAGELVTGTISAEGTSMRDYLTTQAISFTHDITGTLFPGRAGLLLSAVAVAGDDPADFGAMDLAGELEATFQPATGAYSTTATQDFSSGQASDLNQAWAILGLSLAERDVPEGATQYLAGVQGQDGSWGFGDPDTTALAVTALVASHQVTAQDQVILNALQFFHATQLENGGWRPSWDSDPLNADSTGWILQALVSAGEDPTSDAWTAAQGNPVDALMGLLNPDGSIGGTFANTYSTADALIGLSGRALVASQPPPTVEQRAGLAIFPGDGSVITACVNFSEPSLAGLDLLQRSGASLETATNPSQGTAVCKIGDTGCPSSDCFCSMPDYWSYWQLGESGWAYATTGAEQSQVEDEAVNAWSWGSGDAPALLSFENICEGVAFELPTPTQTSQPSTDTPEPTDLPEATEPSTNDSATLVPQPTPAAPVTAPTPGTYIVYGAIVLVLAALIVYMVRSRGK